MMTRRTLVHALALALTTTLVIAAANALPTPDNSTYTNYWEGAMAWSGWWHNQIGLLTEVASARVAAPLDQQRAVPGRPSAQPAAARGEGPATPVPGTPQFNDGPAPGAC